MVEMLTGVVPYKSEKFYNNMAIIFQVGGNKLNPLKSMKRGGHEELLTDDVETFLSKCFKRYVILCRFQCIALIIIIL